jgi:hypothetical protein
MDMVLDNAAQTAEEHSAIKAWVSENIGGTVTRIERQRRWRPVWRVDVDKRMRPPPMERTSLAEAPCSRRYCVGGSVHVALCPRPA